MWTWILTGTDITKKSNLEHSNILNTKCFLSFHIFVPVEAQVHMVPHSKAQTYIKWGLLRAKAWWQFSVSQSLMKIGTLLHNMGFVKTGVVGTVAHEEVVTKLNFGANVKLFIHKKCLNKVLCSPGFLFPKLVTVLHGSQHCSK